MICFPKGRVLISFHAWISSKATFPVGLKIKICAKYNANNHVLWEQMGTFQSRIQVDLSSSDKTCKHTVTSQTGPFSRTIDL